jgi:hypothetical protein
MQLEMTLCPLGSQYVGHCLERDSRTMSEEVVRGKAKC